MSARDVTSEAAGIPVPMRPSGEFTQRSISAEQTRRLLEAPGQVAAMLPPLEALRRLSSLIAEIVRVKVAFVGKRPSGWVILAESSEVPRLLGGDRQTLSSFDRVATELSRGVVGWRNEQQDWTMVGIAPRPQAQAVFVLEGDWTQSAPALMDAARTLLFGSPADRIDLTAGASAHVLARDLAEVTGVANVCELVLRHVVRTVPCRLATLAVPTDQGELSIMATFGYPLALTQHLRIEPGVGVIGTVYQKGLPILVSKMPRVLAGADRRHRYRTDSFVALPIIAGTDVLGVLCATDRSGDVPFSAEDVEKLRVLMAPVALALARERAERQAERFAEAAIADPASGLFNRPYFQSRLEEELQRSSRHATPVSLLMIDIDAFKAINDTFGHVAGDTVIRDLSDILRRSVRVFDVCARYGGEEFAVLMPGSGIESATAIAERIRRRIQAYQPQEPGLENLRVTVSIGVAESRRGTGAREMIERADRALYVAKRGGKNRVNTSEVLPR